MKHWVFSYGSNSVAQLRGRVRNPSLTALPARVLGWERIFCLSSPRWAGIAGSVAGTGAGAASLYPSERGEALGSASQLSDEEIVRLDGFERPAYDRVEVEMLLRTDPTSVHEVKQTAFAYIAVQPKWICPPSEQYLTAIHLMLREQWSHVHSTIDIPVNGVFHVNDAAVMLPLYTWRHPGAHRLSIPALCVEVNARIPPEANSWVMPGSILDVETRLAAVGVQSTAQLALKLAAPGGPSELNGKLSTVGHPPFDETVLGLFKELLDV